VRPVWYTDGSTKGNGTKDAHGGFGVVCVDEDTQEILYQYQEFVEHTTNNRMEMEAIIHAVKQAYAAHLYQNAPIIKSDSAYAVNTFTSWMYGWQRNGWKRPRNQPVEHLDLVKEFYELQDAGQLCILQHIRGHMGNKWNEYCDALATGKVKI